MSELTRRTVLGIAVTGSVSALFAQFEETDDTAEKQRLFEKIRQELTVHAEVEENLFYPRLVGEEETEEITEEAYEEHQEVKNLLSQIEAMSPSDDSWEATVLELRDAVEHHVEEEEGEMFEKARDVLSAEEIEEIGDEIQAEKQKKMSAAL